MSQNHERPEMIDRIEGALFGVAVGDALGAPLEFLNASQILERHGKPVAEMVGGGWLSVLPGEVTDDTQMTLAVAEGILRAHETGADMVECVGGMFLRWYATRPRDVGQTCAMVLDALSGSDERTESAWHAAARNLFDQLRGRTAGNGALMRTVLRGGYGNTWPIPYTGADSYWIIKSNIGNLAEIYTDSTGEWHTEYFERGETTPLKGLGIEWVFGDRS